MFISGLMPGLTHFKVYIIDLLSHDKAYYIGYSGHKGRVPILKSAKVWSLTIEGGEGVTQNQILIQTSFYSVNKAIFSANLKNSE